jgi:hypothetical protein
VWQVAERRDETRYIFGDRVAVVGIALAGELPGPPDETTIAASDRWARPTDHDDVTPGGEAISARPGAAFVVW